MKADSCLRRWPSANAKRRTHLARNGSLARWNEFGEAEDQSPVPLVVLCGRALKPMQDSKRMHISIYAWAACPFSFHSRRRSMPKPSLSSLFAPFFFCPCASIFFLFSPHTTTGTGFACRDTEGTREGAAWCYRDAAGAALAAQP